MAHALRDDSLTETPLIAIDSYTKSYRPLRELFDNAYFEYRENLWEFRLEGHITAVLSDTVSFLTHFWQQPLRVAFIDSSHHYEPTHAELKLILPLILDGGWLVLHDYFSEDTPGVGRAVDEVFESQDMNTFDFYRMDQLAIIRNGSSNPSAVSTTNATSESTGQRRWIPNK